MREMIDANGPVHERDEVQCAICLKKVARKGLPQHMLAKHNTLVVPPTPEEATDDA